MSDPTPATPAPGARATTWRKVLSTSAIASIVVVALVTVFAGLIPPLLVFVLLWIIGLVWLRRSTKGPAVLLLIAFVLYLASSAPFIIPTFAVPASAGDFILNVAAVLAAGLGIVAAIAVLRGRASEPSGAARGLAIAAVVLFGFAVAGSLVALFGYDDATAREGDIELAAGNLEFSDESLQAEAGEVSVFVENEDATLHTFTIDELDVNLNVPAGKSARVTFQADGGDYTFYCIPHEGDMEGTLEVE